MPAGSKNKVINGPDTAAGGMIRPVDGPLPDTIDAAPGDAFPLTGESPPVAGRGRPVMGFHEAFIGSAWKLGR